jgi:hypothetical protein
VEGKIEPSHAKGWGRAANVFETLKKASGTLNNILKQAGLK